ncbi:O-methyltransferase [Namhaeicola litoreus]|uniref:O-methyltransferase n=1 Tax=Namhaeicola litoreus TaxID=1052145 RepID=A0ABW3Y654_9FLAO
MIIQQAYYFIKFLVQSNNAHGIHSPFVYRLYDSGLKPNKNKNKILFKKHLDFRSDLLKNETYIHIQDFGAGSKKLNQDKRQVNQIASTAGLSKKCAKQLIQLIQFLQPQNILEFGTSLGLATSAMALGDKKADIITLEGCPNTAKIARDIFKKYELDNISIKEGDFKETLHSALENKIFDFIYFDGNHKKKPTLEYFDLCLTHKTDQSVFIFDDIHWSKEMNDAWKTIKNHPEVTVTIDTYQWGIVFFRKEQPKQHFILRV